jgi:prolyl-tRNA synthetase
MAPSPAPKPPAGAKGGQTAKAGEPALISITVRKDEDFPDWYQQVLKKGDMLDYYDVSGCYILKPWSYTVWQTIQSKCRSFLPS